MKETSSVGAKLPYKNVVFRNNIRKQKEKSKCQNEQVSLFRSISSKRQQDSDA